MPHKLFCTYGPICYHISEVKEQLKRRLIDFVTGMRFASHHQQVTLPVLVKGHSTLMLRPLEGVNMALQQSKVTNLRLAAAKLHNLVIEPGETFSFWHTIGSCTKKKGYGPGLTISNGRCTSDVGGGLCQLANLVHYLVLHSPLIVRELHHHTDALFPDHARRVPFGTGTSVYYNYVDYRFENTTDQPVQLCIWLDGDWLYGELRTTEIFPFRYRLLEEGHHFSHEDGAYFRNSCIYRRMIDRKTGEETRELLLVNHSRVMYDPALIPPDELEEKIYVS